MTLKKSQNNSEKIRLAFLLDVETYHIDYYPMAQQFLLQVCAYGLLYLLFIESLSKNMKSTDKYQVDNYDCLKRGRSIGLE